MSREEISDLIEKQKRTDAELILLRESVVNLENILDAYSRLRGSISVSDHSIVSDVIASENADEGTDQGTQEQFSIGDAELPAIVSITPESVDAGEGENDAVNELVSEQGRDDVRDASSADVISLFNDLGI